MPLTIDKDKFWGIEAVEGFTKDESIPESYLKKFFWYFHIYNVPMEHVVNKPQICMPLQGRYCELHMILTPDRENIIEWKNGQPYKCVSDAIKADAWLYLVEIFQDHGDDGHVSYQLDGYAVMTPSQLAKYMDKTKERFF